MNTDQEATIVSLARVITRLRVELKAETRRADAAEFNVATLRTELDECITRRDTVMSDFFRAQNTIDDMRQKGAESGLELDTVRKQLARAKETIADLNAKLIAPRVESPNLDWNVGGAT